MIQGTNLEDQPTNRTHPSGSENNVGITTATTNDHTNEDNSIENEKQTSSIVLLKKNVRTNGNIDRSDDDNDLVNENKNDFNKDINNTNNTNTDNTNTNTNINTNININHADGISLQDDALSYDIRNNDDIQRYTAHDVHPRNGHTGSDKDSSSSNNSNKNQGTSNNILPQSSYMQYDLSQYPSEGQSHLHSIIYPEYSYDDIINNQSHNNNNYHYNIGNNNIDNYNINNYNINNGNINGNLNDEQVDSTAVRQHKQHRSSVMAFVVGLLTAVGGLLYGYDTGVINGMLEMKYIKEHVASNGTSFTANETSLITAILSLGTFFGALFAPIISDRFGRRFGIMFSSGFIFIIGTILQLVEASFSFLCAGRFISGFGVGIISAVIPLYQAETSPKWIRGSIVSLYQWAITWGLFISSAVTQGTHSLNDPRCYRIPIGIQIAWAVLLAVGVAFLPESPRFYVKKDKLDDAIIALSRFRRLPVDDESLIEELIEIKASHDYESSFGKTSILDCFRSSPSRVAQPRRMFTGMAIQALQQGSGINFIFYFGVNFFVRAGIANSYIISFITYAVNVLFTIPGIFFVEILGRRKLMIFGGIGMTISNFLIAIVGCTTDSHIANKIMIAFVCSFIAFFAATWGPLTWVIVGEIYSLSVRQKAVSLTAASNWLVNFALAFCTPYLVDTGKHTAALGTKIFFVWGSLNLLGVLIAYLFVYETKGLLLEEIDELYRVCKSARKSYSFQADFAQESFRDNHLHSNDQDSQIGIDGYGGGDNNDDDGNGGGGAKHILCEDKNNNISNSSTSRSNSTGIMDNNANRTVVNPMVPFGPLGPMASQERNVLGTGDSSDITIKKAENVEETNAIGSSISPESEELAGNSNILRYKTTSTVDSKNVNTESNDNTSADQRNINLNNNNNNNNNNFMNFQLNPVPVSTAPPSIDSVSDEELDEFIDQMRNDELNVNPSFSIDRASNSILNTGSDANRSNVNNSRAGEGGGFIAADNLLPIFTGLGYQANQELASDSAIPLEDLDRSYIPSGNSNLNTNYSNNSNDLNHFIYGSPTNVIPNTNSDGSRGHTTISQQNSADRVTSTFDSGITHPSNNNSNNNNGLRTDETFNILRNQGTSNTINDYVRPFYQQQQEDQIHQLQSPALITQDGSQIPTTSGYSYTNEDDLRNFIEGLNITGQTNRERGQRQTQDDDEDHSNNNTNTTEKNNNDII
ncbi:hypothetical protein B5S33_g953 [[Candida] boidinii]|nr:hypothetical protein B5S33_g953 [[Candida] boidinii]